MRDSNWMMGCVVASTIMLCAASPYHAPRNAFGQPDLEGTWTNHALTPTERLVGVTALVLDEKEAAELERKLLAARDEVQNVGGRQAEWWETAHLGRMNGRVRSSWVVSPADGRVAFTAEGKASIDRFRKSADDTSGPESRTRAERCLQASWASAGPPMLSAPYNPNYKILQTRDQVAILVENNSAMRIFRLKGAHAPSAVSSELGDSIGHWEGETLVVETTNLSSPIPSPAPPFYLSGDARVIERFTRVSASEFRYEFTIEDPRILAEPVRGEMPFRTTAAALYEFACHEGNYGLEGILAGAREVEKAAATPHN